MNGQQQGKSNKNIPPNKMDPLREAITKRAKSIVKMTPSMRQFSGKTGVPYTTLQHWTDIHKNGLPETSVNEFINAAKVFGIECSHEWMMYGKGVAPKVSNQFIMSNNATKRSKKNRNRDGQTARIAEELKAFLQSDKDAVYYIVPDDAMEPRFTRGEIVAGIRRYAKDIEKLIGQDCIVLIEGRGDFYLRTVRKGNLPGHFHLAHTNLHTKTLQPFISDVKLVSAAPVIWTRRKDHF